MYQRRRRDGTVVLLLVVSILLTAPGARAQSSLRSAFGPFRVPGSARVAPARTHDKVDPRVAAVARWVRSELAAHGPGPAIRALSTPSIFRVREEGAIEVYLYLSEVAATSLADLERQGVVVEASEPRLMKAVKAWLPAQALDGVAALPSVRRVTLPDYAVRRSGSVNSEGDFIHGAGAFRATPPYFINGARVRVGVISDGVTNAASAAGSGDLPETAPGSGIAAIDVDPASPGSGDEGTAMLEIVHDLAPGATLSFAGPATSLDMVNAIDWMLHSTGAQVVVDDLGFFDEPYFQDGPVAIEAGEAEGAGVVYVSAAGDDAEHHHQRLYTSFDVVNTPATGGSPWKLYDWDGAGDHSLDVVIPAGRVMTVILQWAEPMGSSGLDCDLYVVDATETAVIDASNYVQDGTGDPFESVSISNPGPSPLPAKVWVTVPAPVAPFEIELFVLMSDGSTAMQQHITPANSIFGHPAVGTVMSTVAVGQGAGSPWCTIESFSDLGPSTVVFPAPAIRPTPFATAIDGVSVSGAGGFTNPFYGTSAAASHAAALAALTLSANGHLSPAEVRSTLAGKVTDCGTPGFDNTFGYGLLKAAFPTTAVLVSLVETEAEPDRVRVVWQLAGGAPQELTAYRRGERDDWGAIGTPVAEGRDRWVIEDPTVKPGIRYAYRLGVREEVGETFSAETWVDVPAALALAIHGLRPNPAGGVPAVSFTLPSGAPARLEVLDVAGRQVMAREVGSLGPGRHTVGLGANRSLGAGIYLLRLTQGAQSVSARGAVLP